MQRAICDAKLNPTRSAIWPDSGSRGCGMWNVAALGVGKVVLVLNQTSAAKSQMAQVRA